MPVFTLLGFRQSLQDITSRNDIELLINRFYEQVLTDDVIGEFFTEIVELDWKVHIPIMYDFWETILLGNIRYKGNPMLKHIDLNRKKELEAIHFEQWLRLWEHTVRSHFEGPNAEEAINRAQQIAGLMKHKIASVQ
ncbi:MAG: group III truncated hemoglobin [Bacteroidota bacterium]